MDYKHSIKLVNDLNEVLDIQEFFEKASYVLTIGGEVTTTAKSRGLCLPSI